MTVVARETWTGSDGAAWPAQWTTGVGSTSTVTIQSNAGRMAAQGAAYTYARAYLSGVSTLTDCEMTGGFTLSTTGEQYPVIMLRGDGSWEGGSAGNQNSYQVYVNIVDGDLELVLRNGTVSTVLAENTSYTWTTNPYKFRFQCVGTTIRCKVWLASVPEPEAWDLSVTDATIASGKPALSIINGNGATARTVTWDSLTVDNGVGIINGLVVGQPTADIVVTQPELGVVVN